MLYLVNFRLPVTLLTAVFMMLCVYVTDSGADTLKCIDSKGKTSYTNTHCPSDTRIEKRIGNSNTATSVATQPVPSGTDKSETYMPRVTAPSSSVIIPTNKPGQTAFTENQDIGDLERIEQEETLREITEQAQNDAEARAREIAEQAADDLRHEMLRASIMRKNGIYLSLLLFGIIGFGIYIIKRHNKVKMMEANQKFGVMVMVIAVLLILLALMISIGWTPLADYVENFMNFLTIQLFYVGGEYVGDSRVGGFYLIDVPTKYVALAFLCFGAYGFTTYLGITPIFKPWTSNSVKKLTPTGRK